MDESWMNTFGAIPYGIYVLTTFHEQKINGMIASWVSQVSHDPPLVMVAVHPNRYTHQLIKESGCFALHLLFRNQMDLLSRFKGVDPEAKFHSIQWAKGTTGCPILKDCLGYLDCIVKDTYAPGNHTIFIGEIMDAQIFSLEEPLSTRDYEGVYTGRE